MPSLASTQTSTQHKCCVPFVACLLTDMAPWTSTAACCPLLCILWMISDDTVGSETTWQNPSTLVRLRYMRTSPSLQHAVIPPKLQLLPDDLQACSHQLPPADFDVSHTCTLVTMEALSRSSAYKPCQMPTKYKVRTRSRQGTEISCCHRLFIVHITVADQIGPAPAAPKRKVLRKHPCPCVQF